MIVCTCVIAHLEKRHERRLMERQRTESAVDVCLHELEGAEVRHGRIVLAEEADAKVSTCEGESEADNKGLT